MYALKKIRFNYHDYCQLPEGKRYELIDGDFYMVPAPFTLHQRVLWKLATSLQESLHPAQGELFIAPVDVVLSDTDVVQPDIIFISKERAAIITEANIQGAPDLVVEILSPSTRERDLGIKKKLYERYGVQEYWIADPTTKTIQVYHATDAGLELVRSFSMTTHLQSTLLPQCTIAIAAVFEK